MYGARWLTNMTPGESENNKNRFESEFLLLLTLFSYFLGIGQINLFWSN